MTEVDLHGEERSRQPEYFFNGIVGHVRAENGGYIDSWHQATRLANYWRRFYDIPVPDDNYQHWHQPWQSSENADQTSEYQESHHDSVMDDNTSNAANVPCQIFTAEDLAHLASHLATTTQTLSQHALRMQMEALSDIED